MNILLMARIIAKTGVGNHVKQLSEELANQGHRVWVIASTNDIGVGNNIMRGVTFEQIELRSKNPITIIKSLKRINEIIVENKIEVVHCHHRMAALYMHWYNILWTIPFLYTLHLAPIPCDPIHRMMTHYGDRAIAISNEVGRFLHDKLKIPKEKISYVINGVDKSLLTPVTVEEKKELREKFNIPEKNVVIALHSRIAEVKNHLDVVGALQLLTHEERKKLTVICSGETTGSYYDSVCKEIREHQLDESFVFCGWINARDILGCADALLLPSKSEGFPLNCIEAMFMDVPVTRSKTGGYEDMKDYLVGLESISSEIIAEHIRRIINGGEYSENMVKMAREFVEQTCTIEAMVKNTVAVYQEVLEEKVKQ